MTDKESSASSAKNGKTVQAAISTVKSKTVRTMLDS